MPKICVPRPYPSDEKTFPARHQASEEAAPISSSVSTCGLPPDRLVTIHNLTEEALLEVVRLGGLPSPSLGITKVETPFESFGPITLIGTSKQADPSHTPVYSRDVYTPSAPKNSRGRPLRAATLEEAMDRMTSPAAKRRHGPYHAGRALADTGRRFADMEELCGARASIVDTDFMRHAKADLDELMDAFVRAVLSMHGVQPPVSAYAGESAVLHALTTGCLHGSTPESLRDALARRAFPNTSSAVVDMGVDIMRTMRNMPTDYFEAKPPRIIRLCEFAGAAIPASPPAYLIRALRRAGLKIQTYPEEQEGAQAAAACSLAYDLARERADILFRIDRRGADNPLFLSVAGSRRAPTAFALFTASKLGGWLRILRQTSAYFIPPWMLAALCIMLIRHMLGFCLLEHISRSLSLP